MPLLSHTRRENANNAGPDVAGRVLTRDHVRALLAQLSGKSADDITAFALFIATSDGKTSVVHSPNAEPETLAFGFLTTVSA